MRNKKRFLAIRIKSDGKIDRDDLVKGLWNNLLSLLGDLEAAKTGFWVHDYDGTYAVVECNQNKAEEVSEALSITYKINNKKTRIDVLGISGTIKKVKKKFIQKKEE